MPIPLRDVVARKPPIHPSRTDPSVVSAGSSWLSVRAGLLPIVVEETCEDADLAVMLADRECHWEGSESEDSTR